MAERPLDHFGELITRQLRDRAIEHFDRLLAGHWKAPALQELQQELATLDGRQRQLARRALVDSLDTGIHDLLFALQEQADLANRVQLTVDGEDILAASDGIHGEPYGQDGWYARYSAYGPHPDE